MARTYDLLNALRFDPTSPTPRLDLRGSIFRVLSSQGGIAVGGLAERSEVELAAMEPHVLLAWCDDVNGESFGAIPRSRIPAELEAALGLVDGAVFVGAEDFEPEGFAALVRVYAAVCRAVEGGSSVDLMPWIVQETGWWDEEARRLLPDEAALRALDGWWQGCFGVEGEGFDRCFERVVAIRKMC